MKLIVIAAGIVLTGILFPACSPGGEGTPKSKIMEWIISDEPPATNVKMLSKQIPCAEVQPQYVDDNATQMTAGEIDLDNDGIVERIVYTGSGNRNNSYVVLKKSGSKWIECGSLLGIDIVPVRQNGNVGIFCKTGSGYGNASYSYHELRSGKLVELLDIRVVEYATEQ